MAFDFFAKEKVDITVIEVGLGGLLDSTNIITPELSVITNISFDHTNLLGNTLQEIASQKAGIIKNRVPVVIGETQPDIQNIFFTQAIMHQTQVFYADTLYEIVGKKNEHGKMQLRVLNKSSYVLKEIELDLNGDYQLKNLKTVLTVIDILHSMGWKIREEYLLKALSNVKKISHIMGRFDIVHQNPFIIFDVSHNEAGLKEVFSQIENMQFEQLYIITGFAKDKAIDDILKLFPKEAYYYFTQAAIPRALPYKELYEKASILQMQGEAVEHITLALEKATNQATSNDMILVTGSFYLLSDAYLYMKNDFSLKK
jgi:dihydrofolate synthase/folylpolyglutamate synthase